MTTPKTWFITGVSTGLGRSLAQAALADGDTVIGTLRQREQMSAFEQLKPGSSHALLMDVTDEAQVRHTLDTAFAQHDRIDIIVNNAGHGFIGALEETTDAEVRTLFDVNVFGALHVLRHSIPHLRRQGGGLVINMSSQGGMRAFGGSALYCASKFALEAMSEGLAAEAAHLGIRVMIVEPGAFRTDFAGRSIRIAATEIEAYAPTVGQRRTGIRKLDGTQPGNPDKAAQIIVQAAHSVEPPLRLVLGPDAVNNIRWKLDSVEKDLTAWEAHSLSTNFPD
jgi:NAD(P)-dependent dehydrogenase (short-subunit alcohol dehydrogenase family)